MHVQACDIDHNVTYSSTVSVAVLSECNQLFCTLQRKGSVFRLKRNCVIRHAWNEDMQTIVTQFASQ